MRIRNLLVGALITLIALVGYFSAPAGAQAIVRLYGTVSGAPIALLATSGGLLRVSVDSSVIVNGAAAGYKIARGATAFDASNPTTVATGLTTVVSCTGTLRLAAALTTGTAFVTHAVASGANVDWYAWVIAGTASTGTETFEWVCVGT